MGFALSESLYTFETLYYIYLLFPYADSLEYADGRDVSRFWYFLLNFPCILFSLNIRIRLTLSSYDCGRAVIITAISWQRDAYSEIYSAWERNGKVSIWVTGWKVAILMKFCAFWMDLISSCRCFSFWESVNYWCCSHQIRFVNCCYIIIVKTMNWSRLNCRGLTVTTTRD